MYAFFAYTQTGLLLVAQPYGGKQAAGICAFFAVAEQQTGVTGGSEVARENVAFAKASGEELRAIGFAQVEANVVGRGLVSRRHHVEPLQGVRLFSGAQFVEVFCGVCKLRRKFRDKFCAHFVATAADRWTERREKVGRLRVELLAHFADGFFCSAGERTAPTGVNGGNGVFLWIDEENGNAVGGLHSQQNAARIRQ